MDSSSLSHGAHWEDYWNRRSKPKHLSAVLWLRPDQERQRAFLYGEAQLKCWPCGSGGTGSTVPFHTKQIHLADAGSHNSKHTNNQIKLVHAVIPQGAEKRTAVDGEYESDARNNFIEENEISKLRLTWLSRWPMGILIQEPDCNIFQRRTIRWCREYQRSDPQTDTVARSKRR